MPVVLASTCTRSVPGTLRVLVLGIFNPYFYDLFYTCRVYPSMILYDDENLLEKDQKKESFDDVSHFFHTIKYDTWTRVWAWLITVEWLGD